MEMNHVLVVEDDKEIREGVEILPEKSGIRSISGGRWN